jgi:glutamate synthase domain-containing protein 3
VALRILDNWENILPYFVKVMPVDYKRVLETRKKEALEVDREGVDYG